MKDERMKELIDKWKKERQSIYDKDNMESSHDIDTSDALDIIDNISIDLINRFILDLNKIME